MTYNPSPKRQPSLNRVTCPVCRGNKTTTENLETTAYDLNGRKTIIYKKIERNCWRCGGSGEVYE